MPEDTIGELDPRPGAERPEVRNQRPECRIVESDNCNLQTGNWKLALARYDNLPDCLCLSLRLCLSHEVYTRSETPHVIRAGMQVEHLPAADVEQPAIRQSPIAIRS